jgi:hypothetical protein
MRPITTVWSALISPLVVSTTATWAIASFFVSAAPVAIKHPTKSEAITSDARCNNFISPPSEPLPSPNRARKDRRFQIPISLRKLTIHSILLR